MDFKKYKSYIKQYLQSKGYNNFSQNISCPFHEDKNPSAKVYDNMLNCFSCGKKADIFDLVGLFENISEKPEQFKFVEKLYGNETINYKENKFEINIDAYNKVYEYMKEQRITEKGQRYLKYFSNKRGYDHNFSRYLGYWVGYEQAVKDLGLEILNKSGIPGIKEGNKYSSWHRQGIVTKYSNGFKLMYIDKEGKTIKRGSHGSKCFPYPALSESNTIILCEAEISAIACRVNGIYEMTATGGTQGINDKDIEKLLNYENIIICFDGDDAGKKAAEKLARKMSYKIIELNKSSIIKIAELPENYDPDDLIKSKKLDILKTCIKNAKIYTLGKQNDLDNYNNNNNNDNTLGRRSHNLLEESFFIKNYDKAESMRNSDDELRSFMFDRNDLTYQEAARLYFKEKIQTGLKLKLSDDTVWIYDENKKYWFPKLDKVNYEPLESFIKKYGATWGIEGSKKLFSIKKTIQTKNETDKHFLEYVNGNIEGEDDPFQKNNIPKNISCKNCMLVWNGEKFEKKEHHKDYNLTVTPFNFNYLDFNKLTEDQKDRCKIIDKYFENLTGWINNEKERYDMINFLLSYIGYTFTAWREKCFFIWIGRTDSGKTALKDLIALIHGSKFAEVKFKKWEKSTNAHDYENLPGKLLIADDDFSVGAKIPEQELKTLSSNTMITINPKFTHKYSITNTATALLLTNGNPRAEDLCVENRLYAVPFSANFSRKNRNADNELLINKMREPETLELLFNMAIRISEKTIFKYGNFSDFIPEKVKELSEHIINTASSTMMWLDDMEAQGKIILDKDNSLIRIKRTDLYNMYVMNSFGIKKGLHNFYESVRQKFNEIKSGGEYYFTGIGEKTTTTKFNDYVEKENKFKFEDER